MEEKDKSWSEKELKLLKKLYPTDICLEDLLKRFPSRTASSIRHKASKLGIKKGKYIPKTRTNRKWTKDEINFVRVFYGECSDEWVQECIPHRSIGSIKRIVQKYRPKKKLKRKCFQNPSWTQFEDAQLLKNYQKMTIEELTKIFPNRTYDGIRSRIGVLGLKRSTEHLYRAQAGFRWSQEEFAVLKKNKNKPIAELQRLLTARTIEAIRKKLKRL
jgi:hypothetical protein